MATIDLKYGTRPIPSNTTRPSSTFSAPEQASVSFGRRARQETRSSDRLTAARRPRQPRRNRPDRRPRRDTCRGRGQIVNLVVRRLIANGTAAHEIRIIFATGIHRKVTEAEKAAILTPFIAQRIKTLDHDPRDLMQLVTLGSTSGGIPIELNRALVDHDHVVLVGGVSFHYFAGFTGGLSRSERRNRRVRTHKLTCGTCMAMMCSRVNGGAARWCPGGGRRAGPGGRDGRRRFLRCGRRPRTGGRGGSATPSCSRTGTAGAGCSRCCRPAFLVDGRPVTLAGPAAEPTGPRRAPRPVRSRCRAHRPGSRGPAGSGSRACTTPPSSSGSGATTCGSRASSSNRSTASTTWRARARVRPRAAATHRRARRPPRRRAARRPGSPAGARPRTCSSPATRTSTSGRR